MTENNHLEAFSLLEDAQNNCKNGISQYEEDWVNCNPADLKLGDIVYVEYYPDSQKYLYTHCPEYGTIQEINEEEYVENLLKKGRYQHSLCVIF